jgi:hypothetical protein
MRLILIRLTTNIINGFHVSVVRIAVAAAIVAALLVILLAVALAVSMQQTGVGVIEGTVSIGPWTPVEPPGGSHPPPEVYTSRSIVLEGPMLQRVEITMNGTGYFQATVKAGTYQLDMTNCTFLGCSRVLPMTVRVDPGGTTKLEINIDTGIR